MAAVSRRGTYKPATRSLGGMAQLDDDIGLVMKKLKDMGVDDNTIVMFTTDDGTIRNSLREALRGCDPARR